MAWHGISTQSKPEHRGVCLSVVTHHHHHQLHLFERVPFCCLDVGGSKIYIPNGCSTLQTSRLVQLWSSCYLVSDPKLHTNYKLQQGKRTPWTLGLDPEFGVSDTCKSPPSFFSFLSLVLLTTSALSFLSSIVTRGPNVRHPRTSLRKGHWPSPLLIKTKQTTPRHFCFPHQNKHSQIPY